MPLVPGLHAILAEPDIVTLSRLPESHPWHSLYLYMDGAASTGLQSTRFSAPVRNGDLCGGLSVLPTEAPHIALQVERDSVRAP
jgi:hypothetical protein